MSISTGYIHTLARFSRQLYATSVVEWWIAPQATPTSSRDINQQFPPAVTHAHNLTAGVLRPKSSTDNFLVYILCSLWSAWVYHSPTCQHLNPASVRGLRLNTCISSIYKSINHMSQSDRSNWHSSYPCNQKLQELRECSTGGEEDLENETVMPNFDSESVTKIGEKW